MAAKFYNYASQLQLPRQMSEISKKSRYFFPAKCLQLLKIDPWHKNVHNFPQTNKNLANILLLIEGAMGQSSHIMTTKAKSFKRVSWNLKSTLWDNLQLFR